MKFLILLAIFLFSVSDCLLSQSRAELEDKRSKTLEEIRYVDNLLKETEVDRNESMSALRIIGSKLKLRENVIYGMREELSLINYRIELNTLAINMMEADLVALKNDYARAVINSYKTRKGNPEMIYILSARDFNQGYKRLKYLQQVTKFRRRESEIIIELKDQIETSKLKLQQDREKISDLKMKEENQIDLLQGDQERRKRIVRSLNNKERQLKKELDNKRIIIQKIEREIARIIEEERRKAIKSESTPEQKLIGENFSENRGRLPWPVERGVITSQFGIHKNQVLKNVTEENIGIEITSTGKTAARSVFNGEVARVFPINGANMTVIIRHGKFLSVYANIVNVKVKPGDKVVTKQNIGDVYSDPSDNFNSTIKFMIFTSEYLDPELWISKES